MNFDEFIQNQGAVTVPNPNYNPRSKKNKGPRTLDIIDLSADRNNLRDVVKKDLETGVRADYDDIAKYERYGVSWNPRDAANGSLDVQLAEAQSNWAKLGNALAQTVVSEIGLGTALGISDLFDAIGQAIGVSDHDYNNPVSAKLAEWQDKFNNEVAPIYSRPGSGFGNGTDFGWWMQNIPSIASSLTLLLPAAGGTKLLSMAGKVALKTTKAGARWLEKAARLDRIHKAGHSVGISSRAYETGKLFAKNATTAALSRTMENYQEARQVYNDMYVDVLDSLNTMSDEEYNNFINRNQNTVRGVDTSNKDEVAKAVARQSSDLTFKADYANTVFDIIELYALRNVAFHGFRNSKVSAAARRLDKNARRFAGKYSTLQELEELVAKQSFGTKAADKIGDILYAGRTVGLAQASEGVEEAVNYIAQQEGMEVGKSMLSMEANTVFSNRLNQYIKNPELWESAFWGVAGGIVFQGAGSGLARAKTVLERKNEKKKNKPNEKTGEDVNASTKWKELWELPDVKRVKASIENRLALENNYQSVVKQVLDNNELSAEEKEIYLQALREQRRTELALNAMDSGTIDMLKGYLEDDNVKQALIDKGIVTKEQADDIQREDIEAIQKVQDKYDDNVRRLNAISRNIYAKNGTHIPTEYLQIIARNNIAAQLTVENCQRQLASWSEDATNLQHDLEENDKIDKNINYKEAIRLRWLSEKLGQLEADKKAILDNKKLAKSILGKEKLRELDANIAVVKKQVAELNPENTIENLLFAIQTSLGYEKFNSEYLETGRRKEYADFTRALLSKDTKYFEQLDDKLVGIEERHFGAKDVLSQNMSRALAKSETNISNISKELGEAYAALASLQYMIDAERTNIKLNDEEVEKEAGYIHNYMNEVRKQKIADSKQTLKNLANTYGSENIRNLVTQRYNGQQLDYSSINMTEEDKNLLNEVLDTLNLSEKLNLNVALEVDAILATHDNVRAAQDADERSRVIENSFTSENEDLGTQNQNRDNLSTEAQQPEIGQDKAQNEANRVQTNPQPSQQQNNPSGLILDKVDDGILVHQYGEILYEYLATDNPEQFRVNFNIHPLNAKHFNNSNLFTQEEGVDLTSEPTNYIVAKKPVIDRQGNVIEKGALALATPDNAAQAEVNAVDDEQQRQQQIASTGEVVRSQLSPEQVAGVQEEKPAEDTSKDAEIPYDANDVKSLANADMISEVSVAIKDKKDIDWDDFRKKLNDKYQPDGNTSQAITEDIESVIRAGKKLAERRGVKSVDAVADVIAKSSRLRENTSNEDAKKEFSDSVQNLLDVFNSEVGIDIVNGKRYINIEALCRYCDKVLNDKLSAGLLLNNLIELTKDTKNYCVTDVNTDKIKDKLRSDVNSFDLSNGHLGIDYLSMLRQAETSRDETARAAFYEVIDNIQPGDKINVERDDNDNGGLVFRVNGVKIGSLPYPKVSNDGTLYQANDDWNTDILFIQGGNIQSKLKDLFINWNNNLDNLDIRELNDIILQYMDPKYDGDKSELVKKFAKNKEVQKAIAQKYTVDNPNYETLLKGITKIWRYTRTFGDFYEGDVITSRAKAITRWFTDRVAPSFNFIQRVKENPNIEVEVETITEGELIIERDESKRLPVSKAIGTNYKGKIRLGIAQEPTNITIGGKGINGSTNLRYSKAGIGNTFVVIPARNGDHQVVRAYRQKVSSDNISKTAKDIKNAIYSEIRRICSDDKSFQEDKLKTLETFLRKVLPVYTTGTNKPNATASFFDADSLAETNLTIGDNVKNARGYTISYRQSKDAPNIYLDVWNNGTTHRTENGIRTDIDINTFAEEIIKGIETCGTFNLSFAAINSDLGYAERQYLTRRDDGGKYIISIPNHEPFVFNSYSDFILDNDLVTLTTRPTADGKSNFNRLSDRYYANQQLYVKIINETTSLVEESVEESTTTPTVANLRETEILDILNSKRIKNKANKLAELLFGKEVRKKLSFNGQTYNLFPKNIIFVDKNIEDNALVNTDDRPLLHKNTQILIPAKTVVLGREWLEMATSSNEDIRKEAAKKLLHEQLHILLSGKNQKYVEQIREVFNEFAEKNTDEEVSKYLFTDYKEDYYSHPVLDENGNRQYDANGNIIVEITDKLNQDGLEEFLVESLTSNKLARALNNIDSNIIEDKTKKKTLLQRIFEIILDMLNITYTNEKGEEVKGLKQGSLYEKEFKLLRDVLSSDSQLEINFEEKTEESNIETSTEKSQEQEYNDEVYDEFNDLWDSSNGDSLLRPSRIKENTNNKIVPSIESYVSYFPLEEQPEIINKIQNGKIRSSCK